jgi:hypothetical protein
MYRHYQPEKIQLVNLVLSAMMVGMLAGSGRALAQSLNDSSGSASDSEITEKAIPPDVEPANIDTPDTPVSNPAISANSSDDSAAHPASDNSAAESAPSDRAPGSDESSDADAENGAVLEIPQVVDPTTGGTVNGSSEQGVAGADGNDDDTAQSSQDGQYTAADRDLPGTADQVGTLEDYEDQAGQVPAGTIFAAPVSVVGFPPPPLFNPALRPRFGVPIVTSPIILPPTSSGPFPSTSPMLMGPRFATFGAFHGRGFIGGRR